MTAVSLRLALFDDSYACDAFDCGEHEYNQWLTGSASRAHKLGSARVYVLVDDDTQPATVVGYFAVCPTSVQRASMPRKLQRNVPQPVPGFLLAKLALDRTLRGHIAQWGKQLVREALEVIVDAAARSGGAVIVVDPDNAGLVAFYQGCGFVPTGGDDLRMFMKAATAREYLNGTAQESRRV